MNGLLPLERFLGFHQENVSRKRWQMKKIKRALAKLFMPWIVEFVILELIPQTIGRYRVVDILLVWTEDGPE